MIRMSVNRILPLLLLLVFFTSCARKYKVEGSSSVTSLDGKMLFLKTLQNGQWVAVDSAEVIHGLFSMKGPVDSVMMVTLYMDDEGIMPLVLEHAGKLLEYPDTPYSQEALIARAEILFNRKHFDQALTDYKQLKAKATTTERRQLAATGMLRSAAMMQDDVETIAAATDMLAEAKLTPELRNEALYFRAKAYLNQQADKKAMNDLQALAKDTRTLYGAEAKYLVALQLYKAHEYAAAEKEILNFIEQSTPHAYWLARSFILLSDVYVSMDKKLDARQYLLSLQQNYHADDDIEQMINERLEKLK